MISIISESNFLELLELPATMSGLKIPPVKSEYILNAVGKSGYVISYVSDGPVACAQT